LLQQASPISGLQHPFFSGFDDENEERIEKQGGATAQLWL
jgi:hypothetical protein